MVGTSKESVPEMAIDLMRLYCSWEDVCNAQENIHIYGL